MTDKWHTFEREFMKERKSTTLEIRKFNKEGRMCYYNSKDLTGKNIDSATLEIFCNLFDDAGFKTKIQEYSYFGVYDPTRTAKLIELHPTDEEILQRELRYFKNK